MATAIIDVSGFDALATDLEALTEDVLDAVAERAAELNAEEIQTGTYDVPPGNWTRTGAWRDGQVVEATANERLIATRGAAEAYEGRLATLNSSRRNPAKANAAQRLESEIEDIAQRVIEDKLR